MAIHSATNKRKSSAPDKRDRIVKAAVKVFAKNGFYATRVSEIAKAAGVADGTIYLYFKNKDDVLISIFEDGIQQLLAILRKVAASDDPVEHRITRIIELQLGLLEDQRDLAEVITVNLRQSSRLLKQYAAPLFMEYIEVLAGVVDEGQQQGVFRRDLNPRVVARALFGALDGILLTWALGEADPQALRKAAGHCASLFLEGLKER
ncbi:MAG: TetR/AcrR family transcriptional regulator [Myxococcales bacterium]|nr:TetR/AcrR family transcriptional regulator [Myxococcales bacterium]MDH3843172.1 TetR/AcrR family transcriptional regulator [Myxococcales bacterium]